MVSRRKGIVTRGPDTMAAIVDPNLGVGIVMIGLVRGSHRICTSKASIVSLFKQLYLLQRIDNPIRVVVV